MLDFDTHTQAVLFETIKTVFPLNVKPNDFIKRHIWRNKKYLGISNSKVSSWHGWSANLNHVDFRYRAVFVDLVENNLPYVERVRLFGEDFAKTVNNLPKFVVLFVLDFPLDTIETIKAEGFTPRRMSRVLHACRICSVNEFLTKSASHWAAHLTRLILLQRVLSIHRKPFESNEVPLQNLLYRTGYLHSYIVNGGLELKSLSKPRRAGGYGHDLHAVVNNSSISVGNYFDLGIEVYMGTIGYHINSIPDYVRDFRLSGIMIVAKDDPFNELQKVKNQFDKPLRKVKLSEIGNVEFIGVHHLPFERIIMDFDQFRNELDEIIPNLPTYFE